MASQLYLAYLKQRQLLSKAGSDRECYHLIFDFNDQKISYRPGDLIGIFPENHPDQVNQVLKLTSFTGEESVRQNENSYSLQQFLKEKVNLARTIESLKGMPPTSCAHEFISKLPPLLPRFYSIASSMNEVGNKVDLLVKLVRYEANGKEYLGTASSFLCHRLPIDSPVQLFFEKDRSFSLPDHPKPIIMIAAGCGIAPFRAFMQERKESEQPNWLLFGERRRSCDFYFEEFWRDLAQMGKLKLDVAFSRDDEKSYVQNKMKMNAKELWEWIQSGASLYVCGNAQKMGKAVDATLHQIVEEQGKLNPEEAIQYIRHLRKEKRYLRDVY